MTEPTASSVRLVARDLLDRLAGLTPSRGWVSDDIGARNIATRAVAEWLADLGEMRDSSWLPIDHDATEDHREIVGRALTTLADALHATARRSRA